MENIVESEEKGLYFMIRVIGDFSVRSIPKIRNTIETAMEIGHCKIAFDLTKTQFLDSAGIGLIVNLQKRLTPKEGNVYLVAISEAIADPIHTSGILRLISKFDSLEEADQKIG